MHGNHREDGLGAGEVAGRGELGRREYHGGFSGAVELLDFGLRGGEAVPDGGQPGTLGLDSEVDTVVHVVEHPANVVELVDRLVKRFDVSKILVYNRHFI